MPLAPQVEATKFTEVGFHGRDVDQIVRDLVDAAIIQTRARMRRRNRAAISLAVEERILDAVLGSDSKDGTRVRRAAPARPPLLGPCVRTLPQPALTPAARAGRSRSGTCTARARWRSAR